MTEPLSRKRYAVPYEDDRIVVRPDGRGTRFVLWGARGRDVQIGGYVWRAMNEFRALHWAAGPLSYRKAGW